MRAQTKDAQRIYELGGPAKVAEILQLPPKSGTQTVYNWTVRKTGIPPRVKLQRPDLFLPELLHPDKAA